ncbi:MAG: hypothetical protein Q8S23_08780 [Bacteroidales bacterium]|nr:hypothetical protein [Bacteroidales bacterium]
MAIIKYRISLNIFITFFFISAISIIVSCVKFPKVNRITSESTYLYPFDKEGSNYEAEIIIESDGSVDLSAVNFEIPFLKYNKSWLLTLTQDDCRHDSFSWTWAAINGKPLSNNYYYDFKHLMADDLPPDNYMLGKTLGSTDGTGNELRFKYTTTLSPQEAWMSATTGVMKGFTQNYYRFYMKGGLVWDNVKEILNYGNGIAFHNVKTDETNVDSISLHFGKAQTIILNKLNGRGCKMLAEPDGNKKYIVAAAQYPPIKFITAQSGAVKLIPYKAEKNLGKALIERKFYNNYYEYLLKDDVIDNLKLPKESRFAINIGLHGIAFNWLSNLIWINNQYGKDGDDSVWFTSMEEYFEYNYYRHNSIISKQIIDNKLVLKISIPTDQYFYFPSITINVKGLTKNKISNVSSNDQVQGLSYADFQETNGETFLMINLDCRQHLVNLANQFVERYEKKKSAGNLEDAIYFVNKLKESSAKNALRARL